MNDLPRIWAANILTTFAPEVLSRGVEAILLLIQDAYFEAFAYDRRRYCNHFESLDDEEWFEYLEKNQFDYLDSPSLSTRQLAKLRLGLLAALAKIPVENNYICLYCDNYWEHYPAGGNYNYSALESALKNAGLDERLFPNKSCVVIYKDRVHVRTNNQAYRLT